MLPVILCGGIGSRLWPVSRASFPKPFANLVGESLIAKTWKRLEPSGKPWILTGQSMAGITQRVVRELGGNKDQVLLEPFGQNTAPAIAFLCRYLEIKGRASEVVGIFPADHLVQKERAFQEALRAAEVCAKEGFVTTLGIVPSYPATGFGYIEISEEKLGGAGAYKALGFREKPDRKTAEEFLKKKKFFWNAGIFVFEAVTMIKNFQALMPELWNVMSGLKADLSNLKETYSKCPSVSIDFGIMEKLKKQACVPCDIGWSDVGSWDEMAAIDDGSKHVYVENSSGNYVMSEDRDKVFGFVDITDVVLVDTADATLVAKKGSTQKVKDILDKIKAAGESSAEQHVFEVRPWGRFEILHDTEYFKSKVIVVDSGQQISYQSHAKRGEHWIVVKGVGEVVLNDQTLTVKAGEHVFIPQGAKHRMRNPGKVPVEFVEVQVGTYFGEDDIVRYSDDYGRSKTTVD